jgi:hypothetical protein
MSAEAWSSGRIGLLINSLTCQQKLKRSQRAFGQTPGVDGMMAALDKAFAPNTQKMIQDAMVLAG